MLKKSDILELFLNHRGELEGYAFKILGDRSKAQDVVQDAYLKFASAGQDRILSEPRAYLFRIVRNLCFDEHRKTVRENRRVVFDSGEALAMLEEDRPSAERIIAGKQDLELLDDALQELPEQARKAFELHRFGKNTYQEIASKLGVSVGTAHSLVAQTLERCRQKLVNGEKNEN
jgi:RNA polymerase sigma factor (sigma-70 family)